MKKIIRNALTGILLAGATACGGERETYTMPCETYQGYSEVIFPVTYVFDDQKARARTSSPDYPLMSKTDLRKELVIGKSYEAQVEKRRNQALRDIDKF